MQKQKCGKPSGSLEHATIDAKEKVGNASLSRNPRSAPSVTGGKHNSSTISPPEGTAAAHTVSVEEVNMSTRRGQPACTYQAQSLPVGTVEEKTASGVPEATAAETSGAPAVTGSQNTSEPSDSLIQGMGGEVAESWPLVSISSSMFDSSEPLGLITLVSTVGSWVSAAFDKHDEEAEDEGDDEGDEGKEEKTEKEEKGTEKEAKKEKEDEPTGNLHLHRDKFGETAPEGLANSNIDGRQVSGGTREQALWIPPSSEVQQGLSGQPTVSHSSQTSEKASHGDDSHMDPQVFLHLCGQPTPILWTPGGFVPTHTETLNASDDNGDGVSQQTDPHLLQVPAPEVWTETENLLHSPSEPMSLRQVAENIEMWILDIGSEGLLAKGEGSVSSSDSLDETTGVPLPDFGGDNAFPEVHSDNRQILSDGGPGGANGYSALLQLGIGSRSPEEETSTSSSGGVLVKEEGEEEAGERCLHSAVPRCGAGDPSTVMHETTRGTSRQSAAKESSSLQLRSRSGKDSKIDKTQPKRSYRSRRSTKKEKNSGAAAANSAVIQDDFVPINITEPSDFTDKSESLRAKPAAEANVLEKQLSASGTGENAGPNTTIGELSTEEASAKEASVRSWGNRIWAFFGREAEAERANAGEDNPMDVVERTLPFEDPAVVQRDDHRAFPSETSLLLESIKQEPTLQFLSPQQQRYVASLMRRDIFPASTAVVEEGAEPSLMWCSSGEFEVSQAVSHHTEIVLRDITPSIGLGGPCKASRGFFGASVVRSMTPGEFFGLEELVSGEKLKYTLTSRQSASECALWVLDRDIFNDSVKDMLSKRRAFVPVAQSFLHTVRLIRDLPEEEIAAVAKACKVERFAEGQTVFKMGFHGDMFCFIYKGEAITQKPQDDGGFLELARQGKGEYFGEMALIRNTRRTASVVAGTELVLFCLDKESFETLLSPLKEKMAMHAVQAAKAASTYKRQDDAPATQNEGKPAETTTLDPMLATRDAAEACAKKRTRKNSLALLNYSKIRDQERQAENGEGDATEEKFTARWRLAREPESIHEPPPLCAQGGRSCLKENNPQGKCRKRKSPVRFDEGSLLPSESSSDGD